MPGRVQTSNVARSRSTEPENRHLFFDFLREHELRYVFVEGTTSCAGK